MSNAPRQSREGSPSTRQATCSSPAWGWSTIRQPGSCSSGAPGAGSPSSRRGCRGLALPPSGRDATCSCSSGARPPASSGSGPLRRPQSARCRSQITPPAPRRRCASRGASFRSEARRTGCWGPALPISVRAHLRSSAAVPENTESHLSVTATANSGNGLVGPPAQQRSSTTTTFPSVEILEPPAVTHVRTLLVVRARAGDEGSGMATLRLMVDQLPQAGEETASHGEPLAATAVINTGVVPRGPARVDGGSVRSRRATGRLSPGSSWWTAHRPTPSS